MPDGLPLIKAFKLDLFPADRLDSDSDLVELLTAILVTEAEEEVFDPGPGGRFSIGLTVADEAVLNIVGVDGFALVVGGASATTLRFGATFLPDGWEIRIGGSVRLRFPRDVLKPVMRDGDAWIDDPSRAFAELDLSAGVIIDHQWNVSFDGSNAFSLAPAMIADSGFVIEGEVALDLSETAGLPESAELGLPPSWQGVVFKTLSVHLPEEVSQAVPIESVSLTNFHIGSGGVSGSISLTGTPGDGAIGGFPFRPTGFEVELRQNSFVRAELAGRLDLGFFDEPLDVTASFDLDGNFTVALSAEDGLVTLSQPGLLSVTVSAIRFAVEDGVFRVGLAGTIQPLLGDLDWPGFEIEELSIDSNGNIRLEGGWVDVPETFALDFHAFRIELSRIGAGTEGEEGAEQWTWVGASGGIRLLEGVPLSASVNGLKVSWLPGSDQPPRVTLEGVALSLEIPNTLKLEGAMSYREIPRPPATLPAGEGAPAETEGSLYYGHLFTGSINLEITVLNTSIAGELMIGELTSYHWDGTTRVDDASFVALFIMLSIELPSAIPLGATGAGLYGIKGLFGINVGPDRQLDEEGEPESWYLWYKTDRGQSSAYSVTKVVKWAPQFDHFAFGAGLKIGTVYDDGFTINGGVLAAILIPGPVVMIEGRANLLKQRSGEQGMEGALYALIVLDCIADTFQLNVDVNFTLEDVITVAGGLEAFFDFNNSSNWYIRIGNKLPEDGSKRIRADILSIITAKAYFMIEPNGIQFGASVGIDLQYEYGPLEIKLIIRLSLDVGIFWKEPQITGAVELYIELSIKIFGIGIGLLLQCALEASAPQPWWIHGIARAGLSLPFPLPSFEVEVEFTWGETGDPAVVDLLKAAAMVAPKLTGAAWALPGAATIDELLSEENRVKWPLVPVDSIPSLSLGKPLTSISLARGEDEVPYVFVEEETEGVSFGYQLEDVVLKVRNGDAWEPRLSLTPSARNLRLRPDNYAMEPQVELWWYAPLDSFDPQSRRNYVDPCAGPVAGEHHCVDWRDVEVDTSYPPIFTRGGLTFTSNLGSVCVVKPVTDDAPEGLGRGLSVTTALRVRFPEPVAFAVVTWSVSNAIVRAFRDGALASVLSADGPAGPPHWGVKLTSEGAIGFDALSIAAPSQLEAGRVGPVVRSICWVTMRDAQAAARRSDTGNGTDLRSNLVLEPNRSYVIEATGVRNERRGTDVREPARQTLVWGFHTGGLPGTDYANPEVVTPAPCDFADSPLNKVESYVARTVPQNGAPLFYRGYDVLVELSDPYAANMLEPVLTMKIVDRDAIHVLPRGSLLWLTGDLPFQTLGLQTMLAAEREAACAEAPVPWAPQILDRYIAGALDEAIGPGRVIQVELIAGLPYGPQSVFRFEFTTSRFRTASEHLASGLAIPDPATPSRGVQAVRPLGRAAAPPLDWVADVEARLAAVAAARDTLGAAYAFGPHDAGMTVDEALVAVREASDALTSLNGSVFELLDRGGTLTIERTSGTSPTLGYGGVHGLFVAAGLAHRPLPPRAVETMAIDTDGGSFLLVESPEPIDWRRVTVRDEASGAVLPVVWNGDGTRAFILDRAGAAGGLFTTDTRSLRLSYQRGGVTAPDLAPLYRRGDLPAVEEVVWDLRRP